MRSKPFYHDRFVRIANSDYQTKFISANIEYHPIITYNAGIAVCCLQLVGTVKGSFTKITIPFTKCLSRLWILLPENRRVTDALPDLNKK